MSAWRKANCSSPPRTSVTSAAAVASSSASSTASSLVSAIFASSARSNWRPITAARPRTRFVASDSRPSRRPITSRTPSGMPSCAIGPRYVQRPPSSKSAPDSPRWRITSPMKKGFPSVSRRTACASAISALVELVTGDRGHQGLDRRVVQALERDALDAGLAPEIRQHRRERMGAREIGVAVRPDHEEPHRLGRADEMLQEQQLRCARPTGGRRGRARAAGRGTRRRGDPSPPRRGESARSRPRPPAAPAGPARAGRARARGARAPRDARRRAPPRRRRARA